MDLSSLPSGWPLRGDPQHPKVLDTEYRDSGAGGFQAGTLEGCEGVGEAAGEDVMNDSTFRVVHKRNKAVQCFNISFHIQLTGPLMSLLSPNFSTRCANSIRVPSTIRIDA